MWQWCRARAPIRVDRRYIPGETPTSVQREIEDLVTGVAARARIAAEVRLVNVYPLMEIAPEHDLVRHGLAAIAAVTGRTATAKTWRFGVNATFISATGIPTIGIGPGNERWAHTPDEHVPIDQLITASRVYAQLITQVCG